MRLSEFFQHNARPIVEGGNVFKDEPATGRIQQADVLPTVQWLETITGLPLADHMLGTTGKKSSSGDLDLAVDESTVSKDALVAKLRDVIAQLGLPATSVKKSGVSVHFRTPIRGTGEAGYVQTDFMFTDDLAWMRYMMSADPSSEFSGVHRAQLLASVAKAQGYKVTARGGLVDRSTDQTVSKDLAAIAEILFGNNNPKIISSVENMMAALKNDPNREAKIADARDTFARAGLVLPENIQEDAKNKQRFETEHYGNWTIDMSIEPLIMPKLTGNQARYIARATHKRHDNLVHFGVGNTQGAAREDALAKAHDLARSDNPDDFKAFSAVLNVDFTNEYFDPRSGGYFKFIQLDGKPALVMASRDYYRAFGNEITSLGFRRAHNRLAGQQGNASELYGFSLTRNDVRRLGLIPNMRYNLDHLGNDEDGNDLFQMHPDTRTMGPQDKYRMHRPGVTIAASLLEAMDENSDTTSNGYRKFGETQFFSIMVSLDGETALIVDHKRRTRWKGENIGDAWEFTRNRVAGRRETFYVDDLDDIMQMEEPESLIEKKKTISADEDPCWSGYHMVGTKKKGGREVPNCVPGKKGS